MWEPYFLYFEESDWCLRAKRAGFKVVAAMGATVHHKVHASIQGDAETYYLNRNYPVFLLRNCPPRTLAKALWSYLSKSARTYRESSAAHDGRQVAILREAFWDFISHQLGERRKRSILG
jgi:GT2 family glycosyltransferase